MTTNLVSPEISLYAEHNSSKQPCLLDDLLHETNATQKNPGMISGALQGRLLKMLVALTNAKVVLELGMFTGFSALSMAEGLPTDGKVYTCESNPKVIPIAKSYFARSPHGHKIEILTGHCFTKINELNLQIDFAFIDADKANYENYFNAIFPKLRTGGLIVLDNTLWGGEVLSPTSNQSEALAKLNKDLAKNNKVETIMLPIRDGLTLVRKK